MTIRPNITSYRRRRRVYVLRVYDIKYARAYVNLCVYMYTRTRPIGNVGIYFSNNNNKMVVTRYDVIIIVNTDLFSRPNV